MKTDAVPGKSLREKDSGPKLVVRTAVPGDVPAIRALMAKAYASLGPAGENMDIQYSQSCVLTPCDFPFAREGVAADTTPNVEMVAIADLQLDSLRASRQDGTVMNLRDRRFDLYSLTWGRT